MSAVPWRLLLCAWSSLHHTVSHAGMHIWRVCACVCACACAYAYACVCSRACACVCSRTRRLICFAFVNVAVWNLIWKAWRTPLFNSVRCTSVVQPKHLASQRECVCVCLSLSLYLSLCHSFPSPPSQQENLAQPQKLIMTDE